MVQWLTVKSGRVVAAIDSRKGIAPERVRAILTQWFRDRHVTSVSFREDVDPESDLDSYVVAYEAFFEPQSLEYAYVCVAVTVDGDVAFLFETRARVAKRLAVRGGRDVLVGGHEPSPMSESGLLALLDLIADGQVGVAAFAVPLFGLIFARACARPEAIEHLIARGYTWVRWLHPVSSLVGRANVIKLKPW